MWRQPSVLKLILDTNEHVDWVGPEPRERPFLFLAPATAVHHLMILKRLSVSLFLLLYKNINDCIYRNQEGYDSYDMMTSYDMVARDHCETRSPLWIEIHST